MGAKWVKSRFFDNLKNYFLNQFYTRKFEEENVLSQDTFGYFLDLSDFVFVSSVILLLIKHI